MFADGIRPILETAHYNLLYIINFSLMLDLNIILLTTRTIFLKEAAEGVDFQSQQIVQQKKENT